MKKQDDMNENLIEKLFTTPTAFDYDDDDDEEGRMETVFR